MNHKTRVALLEQKLMPPVREPFNILISWIAPKEAKQTIDRLKRGDKVWERQEGESEDDFKARVFGECDPNERVRQFFVN